MEGLIDSLDASKWQNVEAANRGDGFKEFKIMRQHKEDPKGTFKYIIQEEDGDPYAVHLVGCKSDPLKDIGTIELKLDDSGNVIVGIDLDGDVVVKK